MKTITFAVALALCGFTSGAARAQTGILSVKSAKFASHTGNIGFLALGVAGPLLAKGRDRVEVAHRLDTLLSVALATQALKLVVRERRPDGSDRASFPSGHASAAFAVAALNARRRPRDAAFWYAGAALIGDSRITLKRHFVKDVLAGAALGLAAPHFGLIHKF